VAVHGDLVAVPVDLVVPCIELYDYTTRTLVRILRIKAGGGSICFTPDGKHVAVNDAESIKLMSVDGQSARPIGEGYWSGVAFTCTGDVICVTSESVSVFSATDGMLLRSWTAQTDVADTDCVTVFSDRLYALTHGRVHVYQ